MRIRVTIDHEFDLPEGAADTAMDYSRQMVLPIERVLEDETSIWWPAFSLEDMDSIRVEVVD
jgi:hypothetical protein